MIYKLLYWYTDGNTHWAYADPLFRATLALITSFGVVLVAGPRVIRWLLKQKVGDNPEFDHATLNELMKDKKNTPTMGGLLIVAAILISSLLLADPGNLYVRLGLFCMIWLAILGGIDDWLKLTAARRAGSRDGLHMWEKLVFQIALGALLAIFILRTGEGNLEAARWTDVDADYKPYYNQFNVPFIKYQLPLPTWAFAVITVIVIAGTSNAVNLTDGMDGLASGCMVLTSGSFMVLCYVIGSSVLTAHLSYWHIPGAGELAVLCGAVAGACLGFLWYNAHPAQVFMGDIGALPLGGLMGFVAVVTRQELMLFVVGGIFVIEAISVLLQIFYFKSTGKRIFRCAPIHHHFHLGGWTETQTVTRFWLAGVLFMAFALATIKLR